MVGYGCTISVHSSDGEVIDTIKSTDIGLHITKKTIGIPAPRLFVTSVLNRSGEYDLTEYVGDLKYKNREISVEFEVENPNKSFDAIYHTFLDKINGRIVDISFDDNRTEIYRGRASIDPFKTNSYYGTITIKINAEPYIYTPPTPGLELEKVFIEGIPGTMNVIKSKWLWDELNFEDGMISVYFEVTQDMRHKEVTFEFGKSEQIEEIRLTAVNKYGARGSDITATFKGIPYDGYEYAPQRQSPFVKPDVTADGKKVATVYFPSLYCRNDEYISDDVAGYVFFDFKFRRL